MAVLLAPPQAQAARAPLNQEQFALNIESAPRGSITIQRQLGQALLPVLGVARALGVPQTSEGQTLYLQLPVSGDTLMIDLAKPEIQRNGEALTIHNLTLLRKGDELYLSSHAVAQLFSAIITLDDAARRITLRAAATLNAAQRTTWLQHAAKPIRLPPVRAHARRMPQPASPAFPIAVVQDMAPRQAKPASVDAVSSGELAPQQKAGKAKLPKLTPPPARLPEPEATPTAPEAADTEPPANDSAMESLVLQLNVNTIPMVEFLEALDSNGRVYLPIQDLSSLLDLAITVDEKKREARGWFLRRENALVLTETSATIKGETQALNAGDVRYVDGEFYVSTTRLATWLPMDFEVNRRDLVLMVSSREALPFEEKQQRAARRQLFEESQAALATRAAEEKNYVNLNQPYRAFRVPYTDVATVQGYRENDDAGPEGSYSLISKGELGYMTSEVYAAGDIANASEELTDLRIRFGREDPEGNQLGMLRAREFSVGDVDSPVLPLVTRSSLGRGVFLSNRDLSRTDTFDTTNFIGNATPGWEAELYRNDVLVDFQTIPATGRYEFIDVPVLFGINSFRLILFGPQGQIEQQNFEFATGSALLKKGEFTYNLSADEKGKTISGVSDTGINFNTDGIRGIGQFEYGVLSNLTLTAGGASTTLADGTHSFATGGIRTNIFGVLAAYDVAHDIDTQGMANNVSLAASLRDFSLRGIYRVNDKSYISEEDEITQDPTDYYQEYGFTGPVVLPWVEDFTIDNAFIERGFTSDYTESYVRNRLAKNAFGLNFTNELQYGFADINDQATGIFSTRGFWGDHLLGGSLNYTINPEADIDSILITDQFPLGDITSTRLQVNHFLDDQSTLLSNTLTFDLQTAQVSLITEAADSGDFFVGLGLNFSFGFVPEMGAFHVQNRSFADAGSILARSYRDENFNNRREPGEAFIRNLNYEVGNVHYDQQNGTQGLITSLPGYQRVNATVDRSSFNDPMLVPGIAGYRAEVRPGTTTVVEFPIQRASEIEGYVLNSEDKDPIANAKLLLVNAKGEVVKRTHSEFDGYYYFEGVMPGDFQIMLDTGYAKKKGYHADAVDLRVTKADFYDDRNVMVVKD